MTDGPSLVVDSRKLKRQPGASLRVDAAVPVPDGIGDEVMHVPPGDLSIDILLESVLDGVLATGALEVAAEGECVRCLEPVAQRLPIHFRQFFTYPGAESQEEADDADTVEMTSEDLDLSSAFHDAVVLALPLSPRCQPDCPGLCPECGVLLADQPGHGHEQLDPRWSDLAKWQGSDPAPEGD